MYVRSWYFEHTCDVVTMSPRPCFAMRARAVSKSGHSGRYSKVAEMITRSNPPAASTEVGRRTGKFKFANCA